MWRVIESKLLDFGDRRHSLEIIVKKEYYWHTIFGQNPVRSFYELGILALHSRHSTGPLSNFRRATMLLWSGGLTLSIAVNFRSSFWLSHTLSLRP